MDRSLSLKPVCRNNRGQRPDWNKRTAEKLHHISFRGTDIHADNFLNYIGGKILYWIVRGKSDITITS